MKTKLFLLLSLVLSAAGIKAQNGTDATEYFNNKPFGWATCSDAAGTAYQLTGGYYRQRPVTTVLYASGSDDRQAISNAIKNSDVIILDGSKGNFIVSKTLDLKDIKNKTIMGRNGARLCTQWWLTPELRQALVDANITQYSSTGGGGTLPNGTVINEDRAYYTRLTLIEATGDEDETYRTSGIFKIRGEASNIIIRNLVLQGPGSVDVDGDDLISNNGGNHVWIDHCEFIDALDGSLDSGHNPWDMFVTYSWNVFRYTERSFSHAYSNGTGWDEGYLQYLTYANCIWGPGCNRRMPQADHVVIHLLNNYYNCPGNSAAIAINATSKALVECNYAVSGVKSPFTPGSESDIYYVCRDNKGFGNYNNKSNTTLSLEVPYEYVKLTADQTPDVLTATHGAGATLDDPTPDVGQQTEEPDDYTAPQAWDFRTWSTETIERLTADTEQWSASGTNYSCRFSNTHQEPLTADGTELSETQGLLFTVPASGNLVLYTAANGSIRLNKESMEVVIPRAKKGDQIELLIHSANKESERGVTVSNASPESCKGIGATAAPYSATFTVAADGDVILKPTGGIYLHAITLTRQQSTLVMGDVNGDGKVDVTDVTFIISHILQKTPEGFNAEAADINGDGYIDVTDVTFAINIILGKQ